MSRITGGTGRVKTQNGGYYMLSQRWERIIETLSIIKPENVNIDRLKMMLDYDMTVGIEVFDNLYALKLISLDEYKERVSKYIERKNGDAKWDAERLRMANENGECFNPMIFYGYTNPYSKGVAIDSEIENNFANWVKLQNMNLGLDKTINTDK